MPVGVDLKASEAIDFHGESLAKACRSPSDGILVKRTSRASFERLD
jgi:hypothetical protein